MLSLAQLFDRILVSFLGSPCPGCGLEAPSFQFCLGCTQDWLTPVRHCHGCGTPGKSACVRCQEQPDRSIAELVFVSDFTGPHAALIKLLKYHGDLTLVEPLAHLLAERFRERGLQPDSLVAMPMHISRLRRRGYNQADLLARRLSRIMGVPCRQLLSRTQATEPLEGLDRRARERVVKGTIAASGPVGGVCAIIDDVYTTGASMEQAADALRRAGATRVVCGVLGRTPLNGDTHHTWLNRAFHDTRA